MIDPKLCISCLAVLFPICLIPKAVNNFSGSVLIDFDIAAIGRSILGDTLYNLMFATDEEKKVFAAQKELEEIQNGVLRQLRKNLSLIHI